MKKPQGPAAVWGKYQGSGHTMVEWQSIAQLAMWMRSFFNHGPTQCATIKLCLTALEPQQITKSTLLSPTLALPGKLVNPSRWNTLGRATVQPPALICVSASSLQIAPGSGQLDLASLWGLTQRLHRDYTAFLGSCFAVFMVTAAKAHSRSEQKWGMNDLHSSLGIVLNNLLGFCPLGGTKTQLLC